MILGVAVKGFVLFDLYSFYEQKPTGVISESVF